MNRATLAVGAACAATMKATGRLLPRGRLVILCYHRLDDGGGGLAIPPSQFRDHLDWIVDHDLDVVDLGDPLALDVPAGETRLAITFDDGYRSVAEVAWPELKRRNLPALLYVVAGALGPGHRFPWDADVTDGRADLLDARACRELADDGMSLGSHAWTHTNLPWLSDDDVKKELVESKERLEDVTGRTVTAFAYPRGSMTRSVRDAVEAAGYATAVTTARGANRRGADPFRLRRHVVEKLPVSFAATLAGAYDFLRPLDAVRQARRARAARP